MINPSFVDVVTSFSKGDANYLGIREETELYHLHLCLST